MQMTSYVEFLNTCHENIPKLKVPKIVSFGKKPKPLSHLHISTDLQPMSISFQNLTHPNDSIFHVVWFSLERLNREWRILTAEILSLVQKA